MFKDPRIWVGLLASSLALWLLVPLCMAPRRPAVADDAASIRYICTETGEVFTRAASAAVLSHPQTGRPTLVPAAYDAKRRTWVPGPPVDVMHRRGMLRSTP